MTTFLFILGLALLTGGVLGRSGPGTSAGQHALRLAGAGLVLFACFGKP